MVKIFFTTFFMAEIIIAASVIIKIYQFDRCVNNWNNLVLTNKEQIGKGFVDVCLSLEDFSNNIGKIKEVIQQKRNEYLANFLKTTAIYCGIFMLRGKYKKAVIAYQLVKEIYEGISETSI